MSNTERGGRFLLNSSYIVDDQGGGALCDPRGGLGGTQASSELPLMIENEGVDWYTILFRRKLDRNPPSICATLSEELERSGELRIGATRRGYPLVSFNQRFWGSNLIGNFSNLIDCFPN